MSAYNFFFKEERERILKILHAEDPTAEQKDPEADDYLSAETIEKLKKEGGKISFEEMGKLIGQRWKNIDPDSLTKYSELASEDTERYKEEMQEYNAKQEAKMRSEALKPTPLSYAGHDRYADRSAPAGYHQPPEHMGYGNPYAAYGGMDSYGSYGMGMGPYSGYGAYGGSQEAMMGGYSSGAGYGAYQGYGGPPPPPEYGAPPMDYNSHPQQGGPPPPPPPGGMYGGYGQPGYPPQG